MRNNSVFKSDSHTGRHAKTHKETKGRDLARVGATNAPTLEPIKAGRRGGLVCFGTHAYMLISSSQCRKLVKLRLSRAIRYEIGRDKKRKMHSNNKSQRNRHDKDVSVVVRNWKRMWVSD